MTRFLERRRRTEKGYVAIVVAALLTTIMLPAIALSVDIGRLYVEAHRVQAAADAAATAGVTYLPDDFPKAKAAALDTAARNGYPNGGDVSVSVAVGAKPTQLLVSISSTIRNSIASSFGAGRGTVIRDAVADFNGPAPLGSPCNTFGNEPAGTTLLGPVASQLSAAPGGAVCTSTPQFWGAIAGPETNKQSGDRYMTRKCVTAASGCTGTTNNEFKPNGYFYIVRATQAAVGSTVKMQIYDPAFVEQGDKCDVAPTGVDATTLTVTDNNWNTYANADAKARYKKAAGAFCPGDVYASGQPIVTSFGLRNPTDTYVPLNGAPMTGCARQYPGYGSADVTANKLKGTHANYKPELARVFRQWVTLCEFTVTQAGDYYLQVRTNVALAPGPLGLDGARANDAVYTQTGDDTSVNGGGSNRFALRVAGAPAGSMAISGWQNMSMYMNYDGADAEFNLVRVAPAAATKSLIIEFFDVGDVTSGSGVITVLKPVDSNLPNNIVGCVGSGVKTGPLTNCQLTDVKSASGYQGQTQVIRVPIPASYNCIVAQAGGCWFRVRFSFSGSVPNDTTTWSAQVSGDPVRLIE